MQTNRIILILALGGLAFSGYLSATKLFTKTCALGESCPYFLGWPACYFGFAMFVILTIAAIAWNVKPPRMAARRAITLTSLAGILFAGYFTLQELPRLFTHGFATYLLGLPSCALGLLFYLVIFFL